MIYASWSEKALMGTATVLSKLFIIRHNLYIKNSRDTVSVCLELVVVVNEYKNFPPSFTCDVIYLFLHVLYSTLVSMYCNPPLFTCTVLHLVLLILYFTFVYMSCTAQLLTCIVLHPCLHVLYCSFVYMYCTALVSHVLYCTFVCMYTKLHL